MLVRAMAPQVIAVDEIGCKDDVHALECAMHCGCKMLATVHGESIREICEKPLFEGILRKRLFERYIVLSNSSKVGEVIGIYNEKGDICRK